MEKDRELRKMLKELFSTLPCLTCDHPDPKCPAWQKAVLKFLEKVDAPNEKGG